MVRMGNGSGLSEYLDRMGEVLGAFGPVDSCVLEGLSDVQTSRGVHGDLLEIGAYQGRSAIVMGFLKGDGEKLHICEPFPTPTGDDPAFLPHTFEWYRPYTQETFERNYLKFHEELPNIYPHSSADLPGKLDPRTFRLIHLDGSHEPEMLQADIAFANNLLVDGGIVAFSAYRSMHTLQVAAAVWPALYQHDLRVVCATSDHLYATNTEPDESAMAETLEHMLEISNVDVVEARLDDRKTLLIRPDAAAANRGPKRFIPPILWPMAVKAGHAVKNLRQS